jgi:outer membrane protein assembly factor BamB
VFVGSDDKNLYAIDTASGALRWKFSAQGSVSSSPALNPNGDTVFVGSDDKQVYAIYAIDTASGALRWKTVSDYYYSPALSPDAARSSPVLSPDGTTVFVGSGKTDVIVYGIDTRPCAHLVSSWILYEMCEKDGCLGTSTLGGSVSVSPAISPDGATVFGVSVQGNVYAFIRSLFKETCNHCEMGPKWKFATQGSVSSSPALSPDGATVFVGSDDKNLYAIDTASGSLRWKFATQNIVRSSPALSPDGATVFVGSDDKNLYAIDTGSGALRWKFSTQNIVRSSPALSPDGTTVFVGSYDKNLYSIDTASGALRWRFATQGQVRSSPALSPDGTTVFVGSHDSKLYALLVNGSLSPFTVKSTTKTPAFSCTPCAACPAGQHTVQCRGQSAGTCGACAPGTCAPFEGLRLEGCDTCVSPHSPAPVVTAPVDTKFFVTLTVVLPYFKHVFEGSQDDINFTSCLQRCAKYDLQVKYKAAMAATAGTSADNVDILRTTERKNPVYCYEVLTPALQTPAPHGYRDVHDTRTHAERTTYDKRHHHHRACTHEIYVEVPALNMYISNIDFMIDNNSL